MPVYAYRCRACGNDFEVKQSFSEAALTTCQICETEGSIFRVIQPAGVVFKGSGFYVTDTRGKNPASPAKTNGTNSDNGESASSETSGAATTSEKPAESSATTTKSNTTSSLTGGGTTAEKKAS